MDVVRCHFINPVVIGKGLKSLAGLRIGYRYMVALALYSKSITVAEAIMALLDAGFSDEAFGMTRTLVDIFITLRYIANQGTDERAKLYYLYFARDIEGWHSVAKDFWPQMQQPLMSPRTIKAAARYPHPHRWSGKTVKEMALEPDTIEVNPVTGKPAVHDFGYRVLYRWTSHYVHPTIGALENHVVQAGRDNFIVHSGHLQGHGAHGRVQRCCLHSEHDGLFLPLHGRSAT